MAHGNDAGPQLASSLGASVLRRNVALAQCTPDTFTEPMPAEVDCLNLAPVMGPDLSGPAYHVDRAIVALLDALP